MGAGNVFIKGLLGMLDAGKKSGKVVEYPDEWIEQVPYELRKEVALHNEGILGSSYREGMEASPTYYHGTTDFGLDEISKSGFNPSQNALSTNRLRTKRLSFHRRHVVHDSAST
jgi:hypothetical protein